MTASFFVLVTIIGTPGMILTVPVSAVDPAVSGIVDAVGAVLLTRRWISRTG